MFDESSQALFLHALDLQPHDGVGRAPNPLFLVSWNETDDAPD